MAKLILYIATSLDGYIARKDGSLDWLETFPPSEKGDYGYSELLERVGTVIMGRKTYEQVLGFGLEWPYADKFTYVITRNSTFKTSTPRTSPCTTGISELIAELDLREEKDIWLVGGGELVSLCLRERLLDEMILSVIPRTIGEGIPLFAGNGVDSEWLFKGVEHYETGLLQLTYGK